MPLPFETPRLIVPQLYWVCHLVQNEKATCPMAHLNEHPMSSLSPSKKPHKPPRLHGRAVSLTGTFPDEDMLLIHYLSMYFILYLSSSYLMELYPWPINLPLF